MSPCIEIRSNGNTSRISDPLHHMSFLANITKTDWVTSSFPLREAGTFASRRRSGFAKTSWSTAALYCYPEHLNFHAFPQIMQPGAYMRFLFGTVWWGCSSVLMIDVMHICRCSAKSFTHLSLGHESEPLFFHDFTFLVMFKHTTQTCSTCSICGVFGNHQGYY